MKKILMSSLLAILIFSGCQDGIIISDNTNSEYEDSDNRDYETKENYEQHNQGVACLSCHGIGVSSSVEYDERFTSGGTVYTTIDSDSSYATDYKIRLVLENTGTLVTYEIEEGEGNSYTEYSGSINGYTAQVINSNGVVVNSSNTNSHGVARLDCNTCHTATGISGAPGRITSYNYYDSIQNTVTNTTTDTPTVIADTTTQTGTVLFSSAVKPVLENRCKTCHILGGLNEQFLVSDITSTYNNVTLNGYTNTINVDSSSLLTKASGVSHGGGTILNITDADYQTLKDWITQGTLNN